MILAAERSAEDHVSGWRLRGRSRGRFLCRFFDLHGGSLRHGLAADSGRLIKKRPAFKRAVRRDFNLRGGAKARFEEILRLGNVRFQICLAVCGQVDGELVIFELIFCPRKTSSSRGVGLDKDLRKIAKVHVRQKRLGKAQIQLHAPQAILRPQAVCQRGFILLREIRFAEQPEGQRALLPRKFGVLNDKRAQLSGKRLPRYEIAE